jgi:hypothetical protein
MHLELRIHGQSVISAEVDLRSLAKHLTDFNPDDLWMSTPLAVEQIQKLVGLLDAANVSVLREIALRGGRISLPRVQEICGTDPGDTRQLSERCFVKINEALHDVAGEEADLLLHTRPGIEPEEGAVDTREIIIDGPALHSLKKVLVDSPEG